MNFKRYFVLTGFFILIFANNSLAEHPINVQKNAINKEYYKAMLSYERLPKQKVNKDVLISAAQSAWALSLPDTAIELFDKILENDELTKKEKAKIYLYKGIIDFQEGKYQTSQIFAKKSLKYISSSETSLKAASYKLLGDCFFKLKLFGKAQKEYSKALKYASSVESSSIYLQRGISSFYLASFDDAQNDLEQVSLDNEDAPLAIKLLMKILLDKKDYKKLKKWIEVSNEEFPGEFIDSWLEYAKVKIALNDHDKRQARMILEKSKEKFPESDAWINLANATYEEYLWDKGAMGYE